MPVEMSKSQAMDLVRSVAQQSYGSGLLEKDSGGYGSVGMIGGKPVKFNTHWKERRAEVTPEMIKSSNELRMALRNAVSVLTKGNKDIYSDSLRRIYTKLGMDEEGHRFLDPKNTSLLSRKVAADIVSDIDDMLTEGRDPFRSFAGAKNLAKSSKGVDTKFATVAAAAAAAAAEKDAMIARYTSGDLTSKDIEALNAKPFGTPVPVKVRYPGDLVSLQDDFKGNKFGPEVSVDKLDGMNRFLLRQFHYEIGGEKIFVPQDAKEEDKKQCTESMNKKMKELFSDDKGILRTLDAVFDKSLSIFESTHQLNRDNVTLLPEVSRSKVVEQTLKLSKNADGSYHIDYHKHVEGSDQYSFMDNENYKQFRKKENVDAKDSWDFSLTFDIYRDKESEDEDILIKKSGDFPTVEFMVPEAAYEEIK